MAHTTGVTARRKKAGQPSPLWRKPSATTSPAITAAKELTRNSHDRDRPRRRGDLFGPQRDRHPELGTDEDLGAGLEGGEGPQVPGDGGERGAQAVAEDRPQKDRAPAGTGGCQHHEEGNELPRADRDAGGPDRRRSDVERLL